MVELPDYTLIGADGPTRLVDIFAGRSQLIVYNHMWTDGAEWQCGGCTGFTSQFTRLEGLGAFDARFVIVTPGPIKEALAYKQLVGNTMSWYSTENSSFGADVGAPPGAGFGVNGPQDWHNRNPEVLRFSMTAPGDPIQLVQGIPFGPHGADPDEMAGVIHLDTGAFDDGRPMAGPAAHSDILTVPTSDAWRNVLAVINFLNWFDTQHPSFAGPARASGQLGDPPGSPVLPFRPLPSLEHRTTPLPARSGRRALSRSTTRPLPRRGRAPK